MKNNYLASAVDNAVDHGIILSNKQRADNLKIQLGQKKPKKGFCRKKIVSPSIADRVHVKGSTYMVPKIELSTPGQVEAWRAEMIEKYGL